MFVCLGGDEAVQVPSSVAFSLMRPGVRVKVRYGTTQYSSVVGDEWRTVVVIRRGNVGETEYGKGSYVGYGWWVMHGGVRKFFLNREF